MARLARLIFAVASFTVTDQLYFRSSIVALWNFWAPKNWSEWFALIAFALVLIVAIACLSCFVTGGGCMGVGVWMGVGVRSHATCVGIQPSEGTRWGVIHGIRGVGHERVP